MTAEKTIGPFPDVPFAETDRWDREWMHYFATEDRRPFLKSRA